MTNTITLDLPGIDILSASSESDLSYQVTAEVSTPPSDCPHCHAVANFVRYGSKQQSFMDLPAAGKHVSVLLKRRRYRCRACGRTFLEPLTSMDERHMMTRRLVAWIGEQGLLRSFTSIADAVGISEFTVRQVVNEVREQREQHVSFVPPRWLGIYDVGVAGQTRSMIINMDHCTIIELLKDQAHSTIASHVHALRANTRIVTMSLNATYREVVQRELPGAQIVVDVVHLYGLIADVLVQVRKQIQASVSERRRRDIMRNRSILLKRRQDLSDQESSILAKWMVDYPLLGQAYDLKESFFTVWEQAERVAAEQQYQVWVESIPPQLADVFGIVTNAIGDWHCEVFAYFDVGRSSTCSTPAHTLIEHLNQLEVGNFSFRTLRAKILYSPDLYKWLQHAPNQEAQPSSIVNLGVDIVLLLEQIRSGLLVAPRNEGVQHEDSGSRSDVC